MKFWLDSDGKSTGGKKFFARVVEAMIDKDGKPVYVPTPTPVVDEPTPEVETAPVEPVAAVEPAPEVAPVVVVETAPAETDPMVVTLLTEVVSKCDSIIDLLANKYEAPEEEPVPEAVEEPVPEAVEEPAPEVVPEEEPAPEIAATEEVVEIEAEKEDVDFIVACMEETTEPAPEVVPVVVPVPVEGEAPAAPAPRSRSFAEKMRDASEIIQDRYDELKNYALRFRKLKSRISRKFDSINQGRFQFVKLGLAGKTLKLYLNMDINTTDPKFHCKDMSDKKTYVTVPTMIRIKSGRAVKYAKILIDQCAEQHGMLERRKPFIVDAMALIEESLAAKELPDEVEVDTDVDSIGDAE